MLGPLYRLTEAADRVAALAEARRVLRPGGVLAAAAISRYASMPDGFHSGLEDDPEFVPVMLRDLEDGQHRCPPGKPHFTTAYFHRPDELEAELGAAGFRIDGIFAIESFAAWLPRVGERLAEPGYNNLLLATIRRIEADRFLLGVNPHLLAVGKKK